MDAVEEVKSRLSIEDVIGEYVQLKRAGRNWRGLSPFTKEKTPSFMVSPEKQIWHDFSSNQGGNMFSFVMEMEGLDFKGALELLARKAGVDLEQYGAKRRGGPSKERLYEANEDAARFYQVQFSKNGEALKYILKTRAFSKQTALNWRLGYSPNLGDALTQHLRKKGFSEQELIASGLSVKRSSGLSDMFRGRLMIPLSDPQGRVIGFTARLLLDEPRSPKYINTPKTPLYDKGRHVFGLDKAKEAIRSSKFAVIVEGNMDVIASHQAGVRQVVATAGTALSEAHLKGLTHFTSDIRLCFDQDKAGLNATERAITIASKLKLSLHVIDITGGKDPDELIRSDVKAWEESVSKPKYGLDWLISHFAGLYDLNTAEGKRRFTDAILPTLNSLDDPVEQDHYLNELARITNTSREAIGSKFGKVAPESKKTLKKGSGDITPLSSETIEISKSEDHFLCLMLMHSSLRDLLASVESEYISRPDAKKLLEILKKNPDFSAKTDIKGLKEIGDYVKIELLQYEELYQGLEISELRYEATRLQARLIEQYVKKQKQIISKKLNEAGSAETKKLLSHARRLDELLRLSLEESLNAQEK